MAGLMPAICFVREQPLLEWREVAAGGSACASMRERRAMLPATQEEIDHVTEYMVSQAPDLKV